MADVTLGGRPATITKEDGKVKIVFHPSQKGVKHPKAKTFQISLAKSDLETLKKAF